MIKAILNWFAMRRAQKERDKYEVGFGWAMAEYWLNDKPIDYIEDCLGGYDHSRFDDGAKEALRMIDSELRNRHLRH